MLEFCPLRPELAGGAASGIIVIPARRSLQSVTIRENYFLPQKKNPGNPGLLLIHLFKRVFARAVQCDQYVTPFAVRVSSSRERKI
jgi:hypothetical protein